MTPKMEKALRREVELEGQPYVVTLSPTGVRIIAKGKRSGAREMSWLELVSGEAELQLDLLRSLAIGSRPAWRSRPTPGVALALVGGSLYDRERANAQGAAD
jgi:hypothetical protein